MTVLPKESIPCVVSDGDKLWLEEFVPGSESGKVMVSVECDDEELSTDGSSVVLDVVLNEGSLRKLVDWSQRALEFLTKGEDGP